MKYAFVLGLLSLGGSTLAVDLMNDKMNCGRINHVCHELDGVASCVQGKCKLDCNEGYMLRGSVCWESKKKKSRLRKPVTLCPAGETACPIVGSKSFEEYKSGNHQIAQFMSQKGGYECLDVMSDLQNCGGCSATGTGQDCTLLSNVNGIGCNSGQCVIFSCQPGYTLSSDGKQCQRRAKHGAHAGALRYGRRTGSQIQ